MWGWLLGAVAVGLWAMGGKKKGELCLGFNWDVLFLLSAETIIFGVRGGCGVCLCLCVYVCVWLAHSSRGHGWRLLSPTSQGQVPRAGQVEQPLPHPPCPPCPARTASLAACLLLWSICHSTPQYTVRGIQCKKPAITCPPPHFFPHRPTQQMRLKKVAGLKGLPCLETHRI